MLNSILIGCLAAFMAPAWADMSPQKVENDYQKISTSAYRELSQKATVLNLSQTNFETLVAQADTYIKSNSPELAANLIAANVQLVKEHITATQAPALTWILLQQQAKGVADDIFEQVKNQNDDFLSARFKFQFAKYYAEQGDWNQATTLLNSFNVANNLPTAEADEAAIIIGTALQYQKKHRKAFEYYARVKPDSIHYRNAQLNLATAYIRQDWWTDAHISLKNALAAGPKKNDELANRIYSVLAYSQLQQGFYRDARETFKNIYLDSIYADKALLGLGVAALQQEDFVGALNAFDHLKKNKSNDISISESYLLSAFALNKVGEKTSASTKYTEAISYYEQQSITYGNLINVLDESREKGSAIDLATMGKIEAAIDGNQRSIKLLRNKIKNLDKLSSHALSSQNSQALTKLTGDLYQYYFELAEKSLKERQAIMDNYLSQSRFGLAKLYDTK